MSQFRDPRSRVLWRTGHVILKGQDKTDLRRRVYQRAGSQCEEVRNGKRCNRYAAWDGLRHRELSHRQHGAPPRRTPTPAPCGVVASATPSDTPARSSHLSDAEERWLAPDSE